MGAISFIRRQFSAPRQDTMSAERIMVLEHKLERATSFIQESMPFLPWGMGLGYGGSNDIYGLGYGQALNDDGLPLTPWASGTPSDRQWGRLVPIFWTEPQLAQFRTAARWVADTNPFAVGFFDLLVGMHIQKGCGWRVRLKGTAPGAPAQDVDGDGKPDVDPLVSQAQMVLDEWRQSARWVWRSREGFRRWRRDGETFLRFFNGKLGRGLPSVRFVEPEQVSTPGGNSSSFASFGIESDPHDRETVLAYWLRWVVDDEMKPERVSASDILHIKANVDATVKRGLPDLFPVGADLDRVRSLLTNMGETAKAQAAIAWWEKYATATGSQVTNLIEQNRDYSAAKITPGGFKTEDASKYNPATVVRTEGTRDVMTGPTSSPEGFISVEQALLRGAGVRWNFPEYFSGDASNQNLASIKESGSPFVRVAEGRQQDWCEEIERPTALRVLRCAEKSGRLPPGTCDRIDVDVEPPAVALSDRKADEDIRAMQHSRGVLSTQTWQVKAGLDPAVESANIKREKGSGFDQDGGQGDDQGSDMDPMQGLESVYREHADAPPFPGGVFNATTHRWELPDKPQGDGTQWRSKLPDSVPGNPKSKKARQELVKQLRSAMDEVSRVFIAKYGTNKLVDVFSPEEQAAINKIINVMEPLLTGQERDGAMPLGPISDQRYAGYFKGALQALDEYRALASKPKA